MGEDAPQADLAVDGGHHGALNEGAAEDEAEIAANPPDSSAAVLAPANSGATAAGVAAPGQVRVYPD